MSILGKSLTLWIRAMRKPTSNISSHWVKYWDKLSGKSPRRRSGIVTVLESVETARCVVMWPQQLWAAFIITWDSRGKRPCHQFVILNMSVSFKRRDLTGQAWNRITGELLFRCKHIVLICVVQLWCVHLLNFYYYYYYWFHLLF